MAQVHPPRNVTRRASAQRKVGTLPQIHVPHLINLTTHVVAQRTVPCEQVPCLRSSAPQRAKPGRSQTDASYCTRSFRLQVSDVGEYGLPTASQLSTLLNLLSRFAVVRHPWDRINSAYRSKYEVGNHPLQASMPLARDHTCRVLVTTASPA
jgi:hypothetical protein